MPKVPRPVAGVFERVSQTGNSIAACRVGRGAGRSAPQRPVIGQRLAGPFFSSSRRDLADSRTAGTKPCRGCGIATTAGGTRERGEPIVLMFTYALMGLKFLYFILLWPIELLKEFCMYIENRFVRHV